MRKYQVDLNTGQEVQMCIFAATVCIHKQLNIVSSKKEKLLEQVYYRKAQTYSKFKKKHTHTRHPIRKKLPD